MNNVIVFLGVVFEQLTLVLDKAFSVLVDRRGWVSVLTVLVAFGVINATADEVTQSEQMIGELYQGISSLLVLLVTFFKLVSSWTEREPSGTSDYKASRERMAQWGNNSDGIDAYLMNHPQLVEALVEPAIKKHIGRFQEIESNIAALLEETEK